LGFSIFGVFCVPVLSAVRGFFLCFSISAIVRHFGGDGVFLALAIFGVSAAVTVPCFFILSVQSFSSSLYVLRGMSAKGRIGLISQPPGGRRFFRRVCVCAAVLTCSALLDTLLVPRLITLAARQIL
jgi:stage II sporulation protein M